MSVLNGQKVLEKIDELDEVTEDFIIRAINKVEDFLDSLPWWLGWLKKSKRFVRAVEDVLIGIIDLVEAEIKKRKKADKPQEETQPDRESPQRGGPNRYQPPLK